MSEENEDIEKLPAKYKTLLMVVAIICITVLEIVNIIFVGQDGLVLSGIIGAVIFVATRKKYKP